MGILGRHARTRRAAADAGYRIPPAHDSAPAYAAYIPRFATLAGLKCTPAGLDSANPGKYTDLVKIIRIGSVEEYLPLFSAKLDYALRAMVDLALQPPNLACQSREIAHRQNIRGPYLDQILAVLKRE